jgi:hypothetical protein
MITVSGIRVEVVAMSGFSDLLRMILDCQRRSKNASAGRSKNTSAMLEGRPRTGGLFFGHQAWVGLSTEASALARRERRFQDDKRPSNCTVPHPVSACEARKNLTRSLLAICAPVSFPPLTFSAGHVSSLQFVCQLQRSACQVKCCCR